MASVVDFSGTKPNCSTHLTLYAECDETKRRLYFRAVHMVKFVVEESVEVFAPSTPDLNRLPQDPTFVIDGPRYPDGLSSLVPCFSQAEGGLLFS
ncbi:unnamed protein product [Haemonchus placei]|uniref:UDENN domain-containing protein n=1 Tax=Haemonchus placei TaxID=6290 RepID=A0A0N4WQV9_HAEPC|nr:unnamed protein product [Haemonchus placei]